MLTKKSAIIYFKKNFAKYKLNWHFYTGILLVVVIALTLRLWQLNNFLFFGFEQGRDAIVVEKIINLEDFTLIGPKTDLDGIFHGPWYYYLMIIPYYLGRGSPFFASGFLVILSLTTPIVAYYFGYQLSKQNFWAVIFGLLAATSFELITYSRWLSNVSPAIPMLSISMWQLWQYAKTKKEKNFIFFIASFLFASSFEIILLLHLIYLLIVMLIVRLIKFPKLKTIVISLAIAIICYSPMILFNFRNDWLFLKSFKNHTNVETNSKLTSISEIPINIVGYVKSMATISRKSVINFPNKDLSLISLIIILFGSLIVFVKSKEHRKIILFLIVWLSMSTPIILFKDVSGLLQLHLQAGFAYVLLTGVILNGIFKDSKKYKILIIISIFFVPFVFTTINQIKNNRDFFFVTIQDNFKISDQLSVLKWIKKDSNGEDYKFDAYTIPYLKPDGWQYLHHWYLGDQSQSKSEVLYIIIEDKVEAFWIKRWLSDIGNPPLIEDQQFGSIRVEKHSLLKIK